MKDLMKKYENEVLSLKLRLAGGKIGYNLKIRLVTEVETLENVLRDLRNAI